MHVISPGCDAPAAPAHAPLLEAAGAPVAPGPSAAGPPGDVPAAALTPALAAPVAPAPARRLRKKTTVDLDSKPVNVDGPEAPKKKTERHVATLDLYITPFFCDVGCDTLGLFHKRLRPPAVGRVQGPYPTTASRRHSSSNNFQGACDVPGTICFWLFIA